MTDGKPAAETYEICHDLAHGDPTPDLLDRLRNVQLRRNQLLLEAVRRQVRGTAADADFRTLARLQLSAPRLMTELLLLPQVGCWAVDALRHLHDGQDPDLAYLSSFTAGAALRAGDRPLPRPGTVIPGLGTFTDTGLVPVPSLHARANGLNLSVTLDADDPYLARYGRRGGSDTSWWQQALEPAWQLLCERHRDAATAIAALFTTLVPLEIPAGGQPASATSGWAYGAIALSPPPDPTAFAESLVHEVWHLLLSTVEDLTELALPDDGRRWYAPWRPDARPLAALLQGCFASFGITAFWRAERGAGGQRAGTEFAYRRAITHDALTRAARSGSLTPPGEILVHGLLDRIGPWLEEPVPAAAERRARQLQDEHRTRWLRANPGLPA
ncbi:HEXXH motif-containing protein [Nonomuraea maritima]|uniref:HEXXH motif-containing protein n=1 Tax=Nonomuraea maritima TaxID=683260 RepID=A0A1G9LVF6_9ACTN|nr:HEXXH motif-containing putative peptide modification protein [Nonomuraea maritima]SDL65883.1 HEXXH motif-containing protein [Nonomuraea maritima]